jgi:hypothetical protein
MNFIEWKWNCGEKMEKTPRSSQKIMKKSEYYEEESYEQQPSTNHDRTAYEQSLLSENDIWSIDGSVFIDKPLNKREDNYNKMSEREMFGQINQNPFLVQNNYIAIFLKSSLSSKNHVFVEKSSPPPPSHRKIMI